MYRFPALRQLLYPKEFRIEPAPWPDLEAPLEPPVHQMPSEPPRTDVPPPDRTSLDFLKDVGTGLWRLRQRMRQPGTDRPLDEMRRAYRHLESTWDALAQAGVEIIDHTGAPFDAGLAIKVLAYQPMPELTRERVLETLKPSVYFKGERLQMGEVIVATPETSGDGESTGEQGRT